MITGNYIKMCEKAEEIQKLQPKGIWHLHYDPGHEKDYKLDDKDYLYISFYYLPEEECIAILKWDNDEDRPIIGNYFQNIEGAIWLPTQEQLQEMILPVLKEKYNKYWDLEKMGREGNWVISIFFDFTKGNIPDKQNHFIWNNSNCITELWLAFVMEEKYQKRWDGNNWIDYKI